MKRVQWLSFVIMFIFTVHATTTAASAATKGSTTRMMTAAFASSSSNINSRYQQQQLQRRTPPQPFVAGQQYSTSSTTSSKSTAKTIFSYLSTPSMVLKSTAKEEVDPGVVEGTDLRIVKYPHPSLRADNVEIDIEELKKKDSPTSQEVSKLAKEMFLLMYAAEGVGLAAPQVGVNQRLMVYNASGDKRRWLEEVVLINPRIVEKSDATDIQNEACLSFPDMDGDVTRHKWIKVEAYNTKGKKIKKKYNGWEARIFQHEYDHLDGVVYVDHLNDEDRSRIQPTLDTLVKEFGEGGAL